MPDGATTRFCYGRLPAAFSLRSVQSGIAMAAALDPLGTPPEASNDYVAAVSVPWGMCRNNELSDCAAADQAHTLMLRSANTASQIIVPTDEQVTALYSAVGGYDGTKATDKGCFEAAMFEYMRTTGFLGHKADSTASIDPSNLDHLRWSVQLFGSCTLGLNLPQYAEDQYAAGQTWDVQISGSQKPNGHDVPIVDYRGGLFFVVTWGQLVPMTPAAVLAWAEEAHCAVFADWVMMQGLSPSGFDLSALTEKLESL